MSSTTTIDWRTDSACGFGDPDLHFQSVEDLIEEEGLAEDDAMAASAAAESEAKALCMGCPVRGQCLDGAMDTDEPYGIWGGMTAAERLQHRPEWLKMKGLDAHRAVVEDGEMHQNAGVNKRYEDRIRNVRAARDRLLMRPGFTLRTKTLGTHTYEEFLQVLEMVLANPRTTAKHLSSRLGKSAVWFNGMVKEIVAAMEVA